MQLRQMQYFVTVVQKNSFTEAAEELFISQSAVSQQIMALEKEVGAVLLTRQGRQFSLTEAGEHFYQRSMAILADVARLQDETRRIGEKNETLRIGSLRSWGGAQIRQAVVRFSAGHPLIDITVMTGTHEELYEALSRGSIDIAFNDHRRVFSDQFINLPVATACIYAELSAQSPLAVQHSVSLDDLKDLPCILVASKEQQAREQDYYQSALGFHGTFLFAEDLETARILAAANRGFLPMEGIDGLPEDGGTLHRVPLLMNDRQIRRNFCLFWKKNNDLPACTWFAEILKSYF